MLTYGSLGAVVGLMIWLSISTIVVLLGAEFNAEIEHQDRRDSTVECGEAAWRVTRSWPIPSERSNRRSRHRERLAPAEVGFDIRLVAGTVSCIEGSNKPVELRPAKSSRSYVSRVNGAVGTPAARAHMPQSAHRSRSGWSRDPSPGSITGHVAGVGDQRRLFALWPPPSAELSGRRRRCQPASRSSASPASRARKAW